MPNAISLGLSQIFDAHLILITSLCTSVPRTLILPDVVLTFSDVDCGVVPSSSSFSTATKENLLSVTSPSIGTVAFSHNVAADRNFSTLEFLAAARTFAFLWKP
ncbi:hypothetical protein LWI28_020514 [Acer negundo]|uniref:Uncharacterized protein n=1 Tax=Acer negundo TaxID=4023 RepID=A0AAD5IJY3_ACENE|nr:hypothetical protein LWI28_020514 [Acer negundo]